MMQIAAVPITRWLPRSQLSYHLAGIDPNRAERLGKFRLDEDFQRGLLGYLLVNHMVRVAAPVDEGVLLFEIGELGKPYLVEHPEIHFNFSHSGTWVVCALSSSPVGIDVEQIKPICFDISQAFFSRSEHSEFLSKAPADRQDHFFNVWTIKESYLKMIGQGLSHPLNDIAVVWSESGDAQVYKGDRPIDGVCTVVSDALEHYKLAVCAHVQPEIESLEFFSMERLFQWSRAGSLTSAAPRAVSGRSGLIYPCKKNEQGSEFFDV